MFLCFDVSLMLVKPLSDRVETAFCSVQLTLTYHHHVKKLIETVFGISG